MPKMGEFVSHVRFFFKKKAERESGPSYYNGNKEQHTSKRKTSALTMSVPVI